MNLQGSLLRKIRAETLATDLHEDSTRTGDYNGTSTGFYNDGSSWFFKLVAAGVTVDGDEVTFHSPGEAEYFYENW